MRLSEALAAAEAAGASLQITSGGVRLGRSAAPSEALSTIAAHERALVYWWHWSPTKLLECERCEAVTVNQSVSGCPLCSIETGPNRGRAKRVPLDPQGLTGKRPPRKTLCVTCGNKVARGEKCCDLLPGS